jgi:hypothetical protein
VGLPIPALGVAAVLITGVVIAMTVRARQVEAPLDGVELFDLDALASKVTPVPAPEL